MKKAFLLFSAVLVMACSSDPVSPVVVSNTTSPKPQVRLCDGLGPSEGYYTVVWQNGSEVVVDLTFVMDGRCLTERVSSQDVDARLSVTDFLSYVETMGYRLYL